MFFERWNCEDERYVANVQDIEIVQEMETAEKDRDHQKERTREQLYRGIYQRKRRWIWNP